MAAEMSPPRPTSYLVSSCVQHFRHRGGRSCQDLTFGQAAGLDFCLRGLLCFLDDRPILLKVFMKRLLHLPELSINIWGNSSSCMLFYNQWSDRRLSIDR